jgi:TonB family protein
VIVSDYVGVTFKSRHFRPTVGYSLCVAFLMIVGSGKKSASQVVPESPVQQSPAMSPATSVTQSPTRFPANSPSPEAKPGQSLSPELAQLEAQVQPSVVWVTVFDSKGNLLRTQSGFFISADGRFVTTARAVEGGINAVAKTGDGGIYNINGILAASKELDLAVLQADVKPRKLLRFLELNKNGDLSVGATVEVVGSALAGADGTVRKITIAAQSSDRLEIAAAIPVTSVGSPVVNETGEAIGIVISAGEKTIARPSVALDSVLSHVAVGTQPRWSATAQTSPTPKPTPKPRIVYAPAPAFPPGMSQSGISGTGRFRLTFDPNGNVTNIQLVKSTGNPYFDQAAIKTFRQWKSAPSHGWEVTVPVTFQTR